MEQVSKINQTEAEKKAHEAAERRRRILDMTRGEKAVEKLGAFLAEQGLTEKDWEALQKKLGQERKSAN